MLLSQGNFVHKLATAASLYLGQLSGFAAALLWPEAYGKRWALLFFCALTAFVNYFSYLHTAFHFSLLICDTSITWVTTHTHHTPSLLLLFFLGPLKREAKQTRQTAEEEDDQRGPDYDGDGDCINAAQRKLCYNKDVYRLPSFRKQPR